MDGYHIDFVFIEYGGTAPFVFSTEIDSVWYNKRLIPSTAYAADTVITSFTYVKTGKIEGEEITVKVTGGNTTFSQTFLWATILTAVSANGTEASFTFRTEGGAGLLFGF